MEQLLAWTDDLSVGIEEIDRQHKELVNILNELHEAITQRRASSACVAILDELIEYTRVHFTVEESLFRILGYPGYGPHHQEHEKLIEQIVGLQRKIKRSYKALRVSATPDTTCPASRNPKARILTRVSRMTPETVRRA